MSRSLARARGLLARAGAWIDAEGPGGYPLRIAGDRRARVALTLDEAAFRALVETPGLRGRPGGGWVARTEREPAPAPIVGAPGRIEGVRSVVLDDGRIVTRRANLGESPVAWLARRTDAQGRPWLTRAEVAAAERLRMDSELAQSGPSMTMRWDALPRTGGGGSAARVEPGDRALAAGRRLAQALEACGPARAIVEHICIRQGSLRLAEQEGGLRRREGKAMLKSGLQALARYYRIG